ncbi:hypothetical protein [Neobacillus vireti]|uniref:hypothetical protein n=1 Tax=Neobacillus vireti TaxID=220686 RepID=UPI0030006521
MKKLILIIPLLAITFFAGYFLKDFSFLPKEDTEPVKVTKTEKTEQEIKNEEIDKRIEKRKQETILALGEYTKKINPHIKELTDIYNQMVEITNRAAQDMYYLASPDYETDVNGIVDRLDSLALRIKGIDPGKHQSIKRAHQYMILAADNITPLASTYHGYMLAGGFTRDNLDLVIRNKDTVGAHVKKSMEILDEVAMSVGLDEELIQSFK